MISPTKNIFATVQKRLLKINNCNFLLVAIFCCCSCGLAKGQQNSDLVKYDSLTQQNVYVFVEKMPKYRENGVDFIGDFFKYFQCNFSKNGEESIQTKLHFQFVVDRKGHLIGARIYGKAIDEQTSVDRAGLKALNLMQDWQSGQHNGEPVSVLITKIINIDFDN